jgi:hypothetical protein
MQSGKGAKVPRARTYAQRKLLKQLRAAGDELTERKRMLEGGERRKSMKRDRKYIARPEKPTLSGEPAA